VAVYNLLTISKAYFLIVYGTVSNMIGTAIHSLCTYNYL